MNRPRTTLICTLLALAPVAAVAGGDCTGIQTHVLTPALFQLCLSPHPLPVAGTADPQTPLRVASAAQSATGPSGNGDAGPPKGLDVVKLSPGGNAGQAKPPAPGPWGEAPYPQPGLADAPLRLIDLKPVHFAFDKAALSDNAKQMLGRIAGYLQRQRGLTRVLLIGYADHSGTPSHNYKLSQRRTKAVRAYLAAHGVAPGLLHGVSHGNRMPVDESWIPSGQARNRRVELYAVVR